MNRCLNDKMSYCSGEPKVVRKEENWNVTPDQSNKFTGVRLNTTTRCKLDKATCGNYVLESRMRVLRLAD